MKVCPKCGVEQNDSNTLCVDCGTVLPAPVSDEEEERREGENSRELDDLAARAEFFRRTPFDGKMIVLNGIGAVVSLILMILLPGADADWMAFCGLICFCTGIFPAVFPKTIWKMEVWKISLKYHVDPTPPAYWKKSLHASEVIFAVLGVLFLLLIIEI